MIECAVAQQQQAFILGIGLRSCAHWLCNTSIYEGEVWILGFWTGLNVANASLAGQGFVGHGSVGHGTDAQGIFAEVRKVCAARPSMTLSSAVFTVYSEMANR
jgi:hypothetical protein